MSDDKGNIQLSAVEITMDTDHVAAAPAGLERHHYKRGMSAKNVGTTKLSANIAAIRRVASRVPIFMSASG
jgi:hypothetical protein